MPIQYEDGEVPNLWGIIDELLYGYIFKMGDIEKNFKSRLVRKLQVNDINEVPDNCRALVNEALQSN